MGWITDILKEVPVSAVQRERLELEESRREFETSRLKSQNSDLASERDIFKAKWEDSEKKLDAEKKNHEITKGLLVAANKRIQDFTSKPHPPPEITISNPMDGFRNIT